MIPNLLIFISDSMSCVAKTISNHTNSLLAKSNEDLQIAINATVKDLTGKVLDIDFHQMHDQD